MAGAQEEGTELVNRWSAQKGGNGGGRFTDDCDSKGKNKTIFFFLEFFVLFGFCCWIK